MKFNYNIFKLPTPFHKLGLAGLILYTKYLGEKGELYPKVEWASNFEVKIEGTKEEWQSLCNSAFAGKPVHKDDKVYYTPAFDYFQHEHSRNRHISLVRSLRKFKAMQIFYKPVDVLKLMNSKNVTEHLLPGCKDMTDDGVKISSSDVFLLNFWIFACDVYSLIVDSSNNKKKKSKYGQVIVVPNILDLKKFVIQYPREGFENKNDKLIIKLVTEAPFRSMVAQIKPKCEICTLDYGYYVYSDKKKLVKIGKIDTKFYEEYSNAIVNALAEKNFLWKKVLINEIMEKKPWVMLAGEILEAAEARPNFHDISFKVFNARCRKRMYMDKTFNDMSAGEKMQYIIRKAVHARVNARVKERGNPSSDFRQKMVANYIYDVKNSNDKSFIDYFVNNFMFNQPSYVERHIGMLILDPANYRMMKLTTLLVLSSAAYQKETSNEPVRNNSNS